MFKKQNPQKIHWDFEIRKTPVHEGKSFFGADPTSLSLTSKAPLPSGTTGLNKFLPHLQ